MYVVYFKPWTAKAHASRRDDVSSFILKRREKIGHIIIFFKGTLNTYNDRDYITYLVDIVSDETRYS